MALSRAGQALANAVHPDKLTRSIIVLADYLDSANWKRDIFGLSRPIYLWGCLMTACLAASFCEISRMTMKPLITAICVMHKYLKSIATVFTFLCFVSESAAIDYQPSWDFSAPIGNQPTTPFGKDFLIYNSATGNLVYRVGEIGKWSPPDVGSKSGLLGISEPLPAVPLWGMLTFQTDESFEGNVVPGSNAIRIYFDRYAFWPWSPESPQILRSHGLNQVPDAYDYGAVLPTGLTRSFLQSDLYAVSFPGGTIDLRVVPEPSEVALIAAVVFFISLFSLRVTKRNRPRVR